MPENKRLLKSKDFLDVHGRQRTPEDRQMVPGDGIKNPIKAVEKIPYSDGLIGNTFLNTRNFRVVPGSIPVCDEAFDTGDQLLGFVCDPSVVHVGMRFGERLFFTPITRGGTLIA